MDEIKQINFTKEKNINLINIDKYGKYWQVKVQQWNLKTIKVRIQKVPQSYFW